MPRDLLAEEMALRSGGRGYASAVVVWARPPTSGRPGDRALVTGEGRLIGWIGGSCAEPVVIREALAALADGRPRVVHLGPADTAPPGRDGVIEVIAVPVACASEGESEVFIEPHLPRPRVVGIGGAPLLDALAEMARATGYDATILEREAGGVLDLGDVGEGSAVVVATFGRYDEDALTAALATDAGYVGLVASAKRGARVLTDLRDAGLSGDQLARVRVPAGLDLGHLENLEIAVAILADIVAFVARQRLVTTVPTPAPGQATDPVCGMVVDRATATDRLTHEGIEYVFCSSQCRRRFAGSAVSR